jgi:DNA (cytosine-5)-methyltransferase 1
MRPRLLDLFCGAGGAAMGYHRAGFDVIGVDLKPQPRFPFTFWEGDALTWPLEGYDVIHASPPCQDGLHGLKAVNRLLGRAYDHPNLLIPTRERLRAAGVPYVIEQPEQGAKLLAPVRLCGSSFGLPIRRHRQFESNVLLMGLQCEHDQQTEKKYWTSWMPGGKRTMAAVVQVYGQAADRHLWAEAMGIDWMTHDELSQAIPPSYTEYLGRQLMAHITKQAA